MKRILASAAILLASAIVLSGQQQSGTPDQIRVLTDANGYLLISGAAQTLPVSQPQVFSNARLVTDSSGNLSVVLTGGTISGAITIPINNIATTPTDALTLANQTLSTAGVPVQQPPTLEFAGHVWNTTATAADNTQQWFLTPVPTSGTTPSGTFKLGVSLNGGAVAYPLTIDSAGTLSVPAGGYFTFSGRGGIQSIADGQFNFRTNGGTGVGIDVSTDALLKVRNRAQNADGNISFGAATASGTITTAANGTTTAPLTVTHGTVLSSPAVDTVENDGTSFYNTVDLTNGRRASDAWNYFRLTGSGSGITTIADFFGTNDGIPLFPNGVYEIEWHCYFSQATAGTATWTITTATTNLANLNAEYVGSAIAGIGTVGTPQTAAVVTTNSSATALPVTGTEATSATHYFVIHAILTAGNGASNTRLRLTMSAGTATPLINSYFKVRHLPGGNIGSFVS